MSKKKVIFFSFQAEKMGFMHILLNSLDLDEKGYGGKIVIEGESTKLVKELIEEENELFKKVMDKGLIESVCKACSQQTGVLDFIQNETNLKLNGELAGHPPMASYVADGYDVIIL